MLDNIDIEHYSDCVDNEFVYTDGACSMQAYDFVRWASSAAIVRNHEIKSRLFGGDQSALTR